MDDFEQQMIASARRHTSWRERLQWLRDRFGDPSFNPTPEILASLAVYLRYLATGEVRCTEDGRHYRPNHHAEAALHIESVLERVSSGEQAWVVRRIYPYLPSWGEEFRRSEPLTRIRDIAHRNDIPSELKKEIKQTLQNKLHRCAGPEDLRTSARLLERITAPEAKHPPEFVREFRLFHRELEEFFNATSLEERLRQLSGSSTPELPAAIQGFLDAKARGGSAEVLADLTNLRQVLANVMARETGLLRSRLRLADIALEDFAFSLASEVVNAIAALADAGNWRVFMRGLEEVVINLRLGQIEAQECACLEGELAAWRADFSLEDRFHLLRLRATLSRTRRLAEGYSERLTALFARPVEAIGKALGVNDHARRMFTEGDIRGHLVFQLSRLVDAGLQATGDRLGVSPWDAVVTGETAGRLLAVRELAEISNQPGPVVLLLEQASGDEEISPAVAGLVLGHPLPHLSHLAVRARQAGVPIAACDTPRLPESFASLREKWVRLAVTAEGLTIEASEPAVNAPVKKDRPRGLSDENSSGCGAKAATGLQLLEMAGRSNGLFRAPRGLAIPFSVLKNALAAHPWVRQEYRSLQQQLNVVSGQHLDTHLERLRQIVLDLAVPDEIIAMVRSTFSDETRLAVRSSSNGEDLEDLAGAGLYDSVLNVSVSEVSRAITQVWASLWTRRATLSRCQAGIAHERMRMGVLVQEMIAPDFSFILHTVNPRNGQRQEILAELAVGLGEVLASASLPGTPYRASCHRQTGAVDVLSCASFSFALRPGQQGRIERERLDYSRVPLSTSKETLERLGRRLAKIADFVEGEKGRPQDIEGVIVGEEIYLVQTRPQQGL